jgi:hypothetical protein
MPEISRFYGIVIQMYGEDHPPPHFHARYGSQAAMIGINPIGVRHGTLERRALSMVLEWPPSIKKSCLQIGNYWKPMKCRLRFFHWTTRSDDGP